MRFILFSISILTLLFACKSSDSAKKSGIENRVEESTSALGELVDEDFVDEYSQYEFFQLDRYIIDTAGIPIDSIASINETCYVQIWRPVIQEFEDEESEEAEAYFTAMDDFSYYMYESSERMKSLGIPDTTIYLRYVKFDLGEGEYLVVDTEKQEHSVCMLLYKYGKEPLIIDITDSELERVKSYLSIK